MTTVIDASVIVDLLIGPPTVAARIDLQLAPLSHKATLDLAELEVMSAVRRAEIGGRIDRERADGALQDLAALPMRRLKAGPLRERIWELRPTHRPYDAAYVALAERLGVPLVTTDRRLARSHGHEAEVIDLSG